MSEPTTSPTNDPDQTDDFDPTNRAWQRFHTVVAEQLDVITWQREDGRPVLLSLVDLHSGDIVTLAVIDSLQMRDPHALLVLTDDPTTGLVLSAYAPFDGPTAADTFAPQLALQDTNRLGGCTIPLHQPDQPTVPDRRLDHHPGRPRHHHQRRSRARGRLPGSGAAARPRPWAACPGWPVPAPPSRAGLAARRAHHAGTPAAHPRPAPRLHPPSCLQL